MEMSSAIRTHTKKKATERRETRELFFETCLMEQVNGLRRRPELVEKRREATHGARRSRDYVLFGEEDLNDLKLWSQLRHSMRQADSD